MKKWFKLLGALVFFAGCFMLLGSQLGMTGNVISEWTGSVTSFLSVIVIVGGVLVMMVSKDEGDLEKELLMRSEQHPKFLPKPPSESPDYIGLFKDLYHQEDIEVFISKKALERAKKDRTVRENRKKYVNEIRRIFQNPLQRPQHPIGEFRVSPRGKNKFRIAWHYDILKKQLFIDDLLYHINDKDYTDNWNDKAEKGEITRQNL